MDVTRYELHRRTTKSGTFARECEYKIIGLEDKTLYTGTSSGRFLTKPAVFRDAHDKHAFTLQANRKFSPKTWSMYDESGAVLATFNASSLKRGATRITLACGPEYVYRQADSTVKDYMKASVLLDTGAFVLICSDDVVADSSAVTDPRYAGKSLAGRLAQLPGDIISSVMTVSRGDFYRSESIRLHAGWIPELENLPAAIMLFKDEVIEQIRSA